MLAQNFLKILLVNRGESPQLFCKTQEKHVNMQLARPPVFDERCYHYTQSMYKIIVRDTDCVVIKKDGLNRLEDKLYHWTNYLDNTLKIQTTRRTIWTRNRLSRHPDKQYSPKIFSISLKLLQNKFLKVHFFGWLFENWITSPEIPVSPYFQKIPVTGLQKYHSIIFKFWQLLHPYYPFSDFRQ